MAYSSRKPRLVYVVTHPVSARLLLRGQLAQMREWGFDVTVVAAPGDDLDVVREREQVRTIAVPMPRGMAPHRDLAALARLTRVFREIAPDIVNAGTTKAGLLGMMAARAVDVPVRIYLLRGLRLETKQGTTRAVLAVTERIASACAHRVVCVSRSLQDLFIAGGYAAAEKTCVLAGGSSNGVEAQRFAHTESRQREAATLRANHRIPPGATVIGFIGRLVDEKGIFELMDAFDRVRAAVPDAYLLLVGDDFGGDSASSVIARRVRETPQVIKIGQVAETAPYYAAMDILAFPSFREGFPNVPLEAAAASLPVAGFRSTGVVDAVADGKTGLLVTKGDAVALAEALSRYARDPALRREHGDAGRDRVRLLFSREAVWRAWADEYLRLLRERGLPLPAYALGGSADRDPGSHCAPLPSDA